MFVVAVPTSRDFFPLMTAALLMVDSSVLTKLSILDVALIKRFSLICVLMNLLYLSQLVFFLSQFRWLICYLLL